MFKVIPEQEGFVFPKKLIGIPPINSHITIKDKKTNELFDCEVKDLVFTDETGGLRGKPCVRITLAFFHCQYNIDYLYCNLFLDSKVK